MPDEFTKLWQSQAKENTVTLELIRYKAQQLEKAMRQQVTRTYAGAAVAAAITLTIAIRWHNLGAVVLLIWSVGMAYRARKNGLPGQMPKDATIAAGVEFYRRELERQRLYLLIVWKTVWPVLFGAVLLIAPAFTVAMQHDDTWQRVLPFVLLTISWFVALGFVVRKQVRAVQKEVEELNILRKGI